MRPDNAAGTTGSRWYRHPLGLGLLLVTVVLWTLSNFLASTLFADNTYSKPFLVTYVNSAFFVIPLAPVLTWRTCGARDQAGSPLIVRIWHEVVRLRHRRWDATTVVTGGAASSSAAVRTGADDIVTGQVNVRSRRPGPLPAATSLSSLSPSYDPEQSPLLPPNRPSVSSSSPLSSPFFPPQLLAVQSELHSFPPLDPDSDSIRSPSIASLPSTATTDSFVDDDGDDNNNDYDIAVAHLPPLGVLDTAKLSLTFSILWFVANLLGSGAFEHTTVASGTILACTSGVWTLLFGAAVGVERLSGFKLVGVVLSLLGVAMVSSIDISGRAGLVPGTPPGTPPPSPPVDPASVGDKGAAEIALGNAMALASAVVYGIYSVMIKKRVRSESRITMPLFFGFVGFFSIVLLWPGFFIFHFFGLERFELPPSNRVVWIILINAVASLVADLAWAYAILLLNSPLLVTIGLSLSIPLSLIGQAVLHNIRVGVVYWVGALAVVFAFVLVELDGRPGFWKGRPEPVRPLDDHESAMTDDISSDYP